MTDFAVLLALCLTLLTACAVGVAYLIWDAWLVHTHARALKTRRRMLCGHSCLYCRPAPSWGTSDAAWRRDLELTR